jgi:DNA-directed RNA polymerase alpha subunit
MQFNRRRRHRGHVGPSPEILAQYSPEEIKARKEREKLELSLADTTLSVRTVNTLESLGIFSVGDLVGKTLDEVKALPNFGKKTFAEVRRALIGVGVDPEHWKAEPPKRAVRRSRGSSAGTS